MLHEECLSFVFWISKLAWRVSKPHSSSLIPCAEKIQTSSISTLFLQAVEDKQRNGLCYAMPTSRNEGYSIHSNTHDNTKAAATRNENRANSETDGEGKGRVNHPEIRTTFDWVQRSSIKQLEPSMLLHSRGKEILSTRKPLPDQKSATNCSKTTSRVGQSVGMSHHITCGKPAEWRHRRPSPSYPGQAARPPWSTTPALQTTDTQDTQDRLYLTVVGVDRKASKRIKRMSARVG